MEEVLKKFALPLVLLGLFILLAMLSIASAFQEDKPTTSITNSNTLNGEELRLFRMAFNDSKIEQLLVHVSKNSKVPKKACAYQPHLCSFIGTWTRRPRNIQQV